MIKPFIFSIIIYYLLLSFFPNFILLSLTKDSQGRAVSDNAYVNAAHNNYACKLQLYCIPTSVSLFAFAFLFIVN